MKARSGHHFRIWRVDDRRHPPMAVSFLQFNLFSDAQRVIDFDAEISVRTLKFGVAKQDLNGPQVTSLFVNQGGFGSAHRMGAMGTRSETNTADPALDNASVLPSAQMRRLAAFPGKRKLPPVRLMNGSHAVSAIFVCSVDVPPRPNLGLSADGGARQGQRPLQARGKAPAIAKKKLG